MIATESVPTLLRKESNYTIIMHLKIRKYIVAGVTAVTVLLSFTGCISHRALFTDEERDLREMYDNDMYLEEMDDSYYEYLGY